MVSVGVPIGFMVLHLRGSMYVCISHGASIRKCFTYSNERVSLVRVWVQLILLNIFFEFFFLFFFLALSL